MSEKLDVRQNYPPKFEILMGIFERKLWKPLEKVKFHFFPFLYYILAHIGRQSSDESNVFFLIDAPFEIIPLEMLQATLQEPATLKEILTLRLERRGFRFLIGIFCRNDDLRKNTDD